MKDNFSLNSKEYAQFRPNYPISLFNFIFSLVTEKNIAWDAGTGNGQVAGVLADYFGKIFANDISENQLFNAVKKDNIEYINQASEKITFPDNSFDLITVAQAIHWFKFSDFNNEAQRTLKKDGVIAVFGYSLFKTETEADLFIEDFYYNKLGSYWDPERKYIDEEYKTIPFPFTEISTPSFKLEAEWSLQELIGYINTWSAVQHFIKKNGHNPVNELALKMQKFWNDKQKRKIYFPIILRVGRLNN